VLNQEEIDRIVKDIAKHALVPGDPILESQELTQKWFEKKLKESPSFSLSKICGGRSRSRSDTLTRLLMSSFAECYGTSQR
jgi:hypothetical protein